MFRQWREELDWMWRRCRGRFGSAAALSLAFKALNLILLAPLSTAILSFCLARWGRASVGNFELVGFFASPTGLVAILGVGSILLASLYLELSGLIHLLADGRLRWWQALGSSTRSLLRLIRLGLRQLTGYLSLAIPFLAGMALVYRRFWSGRDLNGLIILKPPAFWWGAGLAGVLVAIYGLLAARWFLRWIYAVPILTLEPTTSPADALAASGARSRGTFWRCAGAMLVWFIAQAATSAAFLGVVQWVSQAVLSAGGPSLRISAWEAGIVLVAHAIVAMIVSVLANITFAAVVLSLYRQTAPAGAIPSEAPAAEPRGLSSVGWILGTLLAATALLAPALSFFAIRRLNLADSLEITAHRAGAIAAPENTVAALRQAIADCADWAEIDVQLTSDKAIVVMHDVDLARVGGGPRRVEEASLAEIRRLDVGTPFDRKFAGERIPTLAEILAAARDRIRLNVELKPHSLQDGQELTRRVVEQIREAGLLDRCRLCSQSYESLQLARQIEPRLQVGYIVATAVGDPTNLDVNFLMVKANLATRSFVDRARLHGIEVHAWTVNDAEQVAPLLDAGIANLITDDPARIRARFDEVRNLDPAQRLLLRAHHALARR